jgi:tetratricopeptide (TPR) repeat protein
MMDNDEVSKQINQYSVDSSSSDNNTRISALINLGFIYKSQHDIRKAQEFFNKALVEPLLLTKNQKSDILYHQALISLEELNYDQALEYSKQALAIFEELDDTKMQIEQYVIIIKVFTRKKDSKNALFFINKKFNLMKDEDREYEIARLYHSLKDYDKALKHFKKVPNLEKNLKLKTDVYNFIGRNYLKKNKPDQAYKYLKFVYDNKELLDKLGFIYAHQNLGIYYHLKKQIENATSYYEETLKLLLDYRDMTYLFFFFEEVKRIDSSFAYSLAIKNKLGIIWTIEDYHKSQSSFEIKSWIELINASEFWWDKFQSKDESSKIGHWKISQIKQDLNSKVTSQSILNFIIGINDLDLDNLYDEEESLKPLWFVEFPTFVKHGEKFFKLRLNNLIQRSTKFQGYPVISNNGSINYIPIERIIIKLRTQWLQDLSIDQIFSANTQAEWEAFSKKPDKTWLKNVYKMDLGDHSKSENAIELTCHVDIFFTASNENPDIKISNINHRTPVYRKNRIQKVEKFKTNNENTLTLLIALSSILSSFYIFISNSNIINILLGQTFFNQNIDIILLGIILFIFGFSIGFYAIFIREISSENTRTKVQK